MSTNTLDHSRQAEKPLEEVPGQRPLHVLHGVLSLELGGLERLVLDLVKIGRQRGQRVSIVCIERPGLLAVAAADLGAEVHCLAKPAGRSAAAVERATELLNRLRPDVVHAHQIGALWYLGQAAQRVGGIGVVHTEHSDHVAHAKNWWRKIKTRLMWRETSRWAGRFCGVSEDIAASVRRWGTVPRRKVSVVLNGIDTDVYGDRSGREVVRAELGVGQSDMLIGTVGRLVEVKRQDLLIRAFARVQRRFETARLVLVGDGEERGRLESLVGELDLQGRVIFAGYQAQPQRFYQAMDVFALSSRHEGLPLALLEAWASGLPVIAPAVGGIAKIVNDEETGLMFPREDEAALAAAMTRLCDDSVLAGRLANAGRELVGERYSLARMADEYERHYRELLAEA